MINRTELLKSYLTNEEYENIQQDAIHFADMPLPVWHFEITGKRLFELSNFDLIRCIRQNIFTELATFEIVERIDKHGSPFYADMDSIELIEKLSSVRSDLLSIYQDKLNKMIHHIEQNQLIHSANVWMCDEQKKTYQSYINIIKSKIR